MQIRGILPGIGQEKKSGSRAWQDGETGEAREAPVPGVGFQASRPARRTPDDPSAALVRQGEITLPAVRNQPILSLAPGCGPVAGRDRETVWVVHSPGGTLSGEPASIQS